MSRHYHVKRLVSGVLIAALIIYFSYSSWHGSAAPEVMAPPTVVVSATPVVIEDSPIIINVFGSLRAMDSAAVASEIEGTITELFFNAGQAVKTGDPLIRIDDESEQAQLAAANAQVELNTLEYKRVASLLTKNAISQQEVDRAKANLDVSLADQKIAQASLDKTLIKAPFMGVVGAKKLSVGQYVNMGSPLLDIVDGRHLILEFNVSEQYLSELALRQSVNITTSAYPDETFTGTVNFIAPNIDVATRTLGVEALIDNNEGHLAPGLSVKLSHVLGYKKNSVKIPEESLLPTVEGYRVYVVHDNIASSVPIEIASRVKGYVYIAEGLKAGDIVVTRGQEKLRDGATVEILKENKEV